MNKLPHRRHDRMARKIPFVVDDSDMRRRQGWIEIAADGNSDMT